VQALAFIDLLGFSQMVGSNSSRSKEILNDFYNITFRIIKGKDEVQGHLFSDSLLAYSNAPAVLVNIITEIYRECLKKNDTYEFNLSKHFLLPRGGISYGVVDIQHRIEAPNLSKNFIVSPALVHSAKMESQTLKIIMNKFSIGIATLQVFFMKTPRSHFGQTISIMMPYGF